MQLKMPNFNEKCNQLIFQVRSMWFATSYAFISISLVPSISTLDKLSIQIQDLFGPFLALKGLFICMFMTRATGGLVFRGQYLEYMTSQYHIAQWVYTTEPPWTNIITPP